MLLRSMSPQILALDEITRGEDCESLVECAGCGCGILATAHGGALSDLHRRPAYRQLLEAKLFQQVILISQNGSERQYRMEAFS